MYEDFLAERLATLREQKNISAREMSLAIGQNASYINRIENKHAFPSMQCFFYICEYLNVTPAEFFDAEISNPDRYSRILSNLRQLSDSQLALLDALLDELSKKS